MLKFTQSTMTHSNNIIRYFLQYTHLMWAHRLITVRVPLCLKYLIISYWLNMYTRKRDERIELSICSADFFSLQINIIEAQRWFGNFVLEIISCFINIHRQRGNRKKAAKNRFSFINSSIHLLRVYIFIQCLQLSTKLNWYLLISAC